MAKYDSTSRSAEQVKASKRNSYIVYVVIAALALWGTYMFSSSGWNSFSFKTDLIKDGSSIFMKYFFIIVALERAAAVWTGIDRNQNKRVWDRRVKRVRELLEAKFEEVKLPELKQMYLREKVIVKDIEDNSNTFLKIEDPYVNSSYLDEKTEKEALIGYLRSVKHAYEFRRTKYEEITYQLITRIVFIGGVILAIIGLSIVSDIIDISTVTSASQKFAYKFVDIIITGGLLGGGSKSFSVFVNTIDRVLNRAKDPSGES